VSRDKVLFENKWISVIERDGWYTLSHQPTGPEGVAVFVYDSKRNKALARYEHCPAHCKPEEFYITAITGSMDKEGKSPLDIAVMELEEEAGLITTPGSLVSLGTCLPMKSSDYKQHLFALDYDSSLPLLKPSGDGTEGEEGAYVEWVSLPELVFCSAPSVGLSVARLKMRGLL